MQMHQLPGKKEYKIRVFDLVAILIFPAFRLQLFRQRISKLRSENYFFEDKCEIDALYAGINQGISEPFSQQEAEHFLETMAIDNQLMYSDGIVYMI